MERRANLLSREGMERVSPVQLAFWRTLMAWLCCCKGPKPKNHNSACASLSLPESRSSGLPVALSAPRHGDFPHSISGSELPVCPLRGHASPALQTVKLQDERSSRTKYWQIRWLSIAWLDLNVLNSKGSAFMSIPFQASLKSLSRLQSNTPKQSVSSMLDCPNLPHFQTNCKWRAWREWAPFSWRSGERSWHDFAAAKDQSPRTTTQHVLRCRFQSQDLLVSQWHSLPQGTGTFPTAYLGANSLCVRCVAMLPLPSKLSNYKMRDLPAQNIDKSDDSQ